MKLFSFHPPRAPLVGAAFHRRPTTPSVGAAFHRRPPSPAPIRAIRVICGFSLALAILALPALAAVRDGETIRLWKGWNLVYLTVEPTESADEVFASWPVDKVASYEAAAFNATQQYSSSGDTEGLAAATMKMWYAGAQNAESTFRRLKANGVYVVNCTNASFSTTLFGVPHAARCVWHSTRGDTALANYIGLALDPAAGEVRLADYFLGCTSGFSSIRRVSGYDTTTLEEEYAWGEVTGSAGEAFAFDATRATDWSGPVFVSPETGLDFGSSLTAAALTLRNDSGTNLTVRLSLAPAQGADAPALIAGVLVRRRADAGGAWIALSPAAPYEIALSPGASEVVSLALDRAKNAPGEVGGLLRLADVSAGTHWLTSVPVSASITAATAAATDWKRGLWSADVTVDTASFVTTNREIVAAPSSGAMAFRLPVYFSASGEPSLLQRVETYRDASGTVHYCAGEAETNGWTLVRRFSSVVLPLHTPVIAADPSRAEDAWSFTWTVGEHSPDNPFRHARHPDHDGLTADYAGSAPSGDDPMNYLGDVKPELFSLTNVLTLSFSNLSWTPNARLSGRCRWEIAGLHAAGPLFAEGDFILTRKIDGEVTFAEKKEEVQ